MKETRLSVIPAVSLARHERVTLLVEAVGGLKRASEIAGVSADTINNWRKEGAKLPMDGMLQLSQAAGVSLDWVATGHMVRPDLLDWTGPGLADGPASNFGGLGFERLMPLRAERAAGGGVEVNRFIPSEIAVSGQWLKREFGLDADRARYAILDDDGMAPRLGRGALVVLDAQPQKQLRSGVVLLEGDELVARRLYRMPDGYFELLADGDANWRYRTNRLDQLPPLHRIVWGGQNL